MENKENIYHTVACNRANTIFSTNQIAEFILKKDSRSTCISKLNHSTLRVY